MKPGEHVDFDFQLDLAEMANSLDTADVVALYFPLLRKTLIIDARSSAVDAPMIKIVEMVATPEERFRSLRRLRPRFPRPESLTLIPWPKYVQSLVNLGMWDHLVARFVNLGFTDTVRECEGCLEELTAMEKEEIRRALNGENYKSLWESKPGGWTEADGDLEDGTGV
ncbi:MAG TPA: hypothetical protein VM013_04560 [Dehalococcoidia bacterium]|nr:hypothetical protein [Dehalococcoidia bacterium]